jgi:hypothetical protein
MFLTGEKGICLAHHSIAQLVDNGSCHLLFNIPTIMLSTHSEPPPTIGGSAKLILRVATIWDG